MNRLRHYSANGLNQLGGGAARRTWRVSFFGIPAHPMMNDVPGTLLPMVSICDLLYLVSRDRSWAIGGFRMLQLGNFGAVIAAILGILDFLRLPATPDVRRLG